MHLTLLGSGRVQSSREPDTTNSTHQGRHEFSDSEFTMLGVESTNIYSCLFLSENNQSLWITLYLLLHNMF